MARKKLKKYIISINLSSLKNTVQKDKIVTLNGKLDSDPTLEYKENYGFPNGAVYTGKKRVKMVRTMEK